PPLARPTTSLFLVHDPSTTEIYPLSLHDALPISTAVGHPILRVAAAALPLVPRRIPLAVTSHPGRGARRAVVEDPRPSTACPHRRSSVARENPSGDCECGSTADPETGWRAFCPWAG